VEIDARDRGIKMSGKKRIITFAVAVLILFFVSDEIAIYAFFYVVDIFGYVAAILSLTLIVLLSCWLFWKLAKFIGDKK
jgi:hypothetical protein